jgi:hypothetical protein
MIQSQTYQARIVNSTNYWGKPTDNSPTFTPADEAMANILGYCPTVGNIFSSKRESPYNISHSDPRLRRAMSEIDRFLISYRPGDRTPIPRGGPASLDNIASERHTGSGTIDGAVDDALTPNSISRHQYENEVARQLRGMFHYSMSRKQDLEIIGRHEGKTQGGKKKSYRHGESPAGNYHKMRESRRRSWTQILRPGRFSRHSGWF